MSADDTSRPRIIEAGEVLLDRYVVEGQVAEGGMAAIHRTHDRATGQTVALKVLYPFYSQNEVVRTRFLDEGRIQRYLDHPNIIDVYDIVDDPQLAIVMEYIDGPTLDEYLDDHGALGVRELLSLMLPVLSAVGFAHHQGIIHRDIKPSNILLNPGAAGLEPKIMDFGVAKVEGGRELTAAGTTVGTLHYMSPEQIVGSKDIDGRADIYSLGVTIYKLCTGEVPFNASTEFALMMAQVEARPTPPTEIRAEISEALEQIILKALAKKPDDRFQTVKELTSALLDLETEPSNYDQTDTDTAPLPADLLEYAMMADEVAIDRTGELDITQFQEVATSEQSKPQVATLDATIQLDRRRLEAQILEDKSDDDSTRPRDKIDASTTTPFERHKTPESKPVDSKERTKPFGRAPDDTQESKASVDSASDTLSMSQETTQRIVTSDVDSSQEITAVNAIEELAPGDDSQEITNVNSVQELASADDSQERPSPDRNHEFLAIDNLEQLAGADDSQEITSVDDRQRVRGVDDSQEVTSVDDSQEVVSADASQEVGVDSKEVTQDRIAREQEEHAAMRARASGRDSLTKKSRDEAKEHIARLADANTSLLSPLQWVLLGLGVVVIAGLSAAIIWLLITG
jgi:eukaryotic-like serine/threonine-protein kinase